MDVIVELINKIISSVPLLIIAAILGLDSIRAVLASLGLFDSNTKLGRIIYGKRDKTIVKAVLRDLGYSAETSDEIITKMKKIPKSAFMANAGVRAEDAAVQLIIMLSKYTFEFSDIILYGGERLTRSNYYIDTMEISHSKDDRQKLAAIMIYLLYTKGKSKKAPEVIMTPKGGNPLFVQEVANTLNSHLISAKSSTDKSRIKIADESAYPQKEFLVNYEGSWFLSEVSEKQSCVIMDCNTSGGSQLLDIVKDTRALVDKSKGLLKIQNPTDIFILFRADTEGDNIDSKFSAHQCTIHRFFDLDEEAKSRMYRLKASRQEKDRLLSYYSDEDVEEARSIIQYLKDKGLYYYNVNEVQSEPAGDTEKMVHDAEKQE